MLERLRTFGDVGVSTLCCKFVHLWQYLVETHKAQSATILTVEQQSKQIHNSQATSHHPGGYSFQARPVSNTLV